MVLKISKIFKIIILLLKIKKIMITQTAAKKRYENAKQVLAAGMIYFYNCLNLIADNLSALVATTNTEACAALQSLVATFEDKTFYP